MIPYAGCVPSALRHVLGTLPNDHEATFVDLGCGKGRALAVASEFSFRAVMGIELNPDLVAVARRNARRVSAAQPTRPAIRIDEGDASAPALPEGDVVLFLYHPFGEPLIRRLTQHLVQSHAPGRVIHVIYENPVHGAVFDDHPAFRRIFAAMLSCTAEECRFAFDADEAIAIWRLDDDGDDAATRHPIVVTKPGYRAVIRD
nr:class I SAM-dependent methyltransferase [Sphingomonas sp. CROZ-RG-20F-R02-07]